MSGEEVDYWSDVDEDALAQLDCDGVALEIQGCQSKPNSEVSSSTKFVLECDKILEGQGVPIQRHRRQYLTVSDLASQHWCEQKLLYNFNMEVYLMRAEPGVEVKVQEDPKAKVAKGKGSDIHLARELEIQVPIEVPVETKEDKWAVKFHNLQAAILSFHGGSKIAREIPVFGCPFDGQVFVFGIVDEISYDPTSHCMEILELKTRRSLHLPKNSHQEKDKFQLGLYRQLFNELILGKLTKDLIQNHLGLDLNKSLSKAVADLLSSACDVNVEEINLHTVLDSLLNQMQTMTCIESGRVEYVHQETKTTLAYISLDKDPQEIRSCFENFCQWWNGDRGTHGVDIEDCWKCDFCEFSPLCEWRDFMAQKASKQGKKREAT